MKQILNQIQYLELKLEVYVNNLVHDIQTKEIANIHIVYAPFSIN